MYTEEAPAGVDMPYAVWTFPSIHAAYDLQDNANESLSVQLDIYAKSEDMVLTLFDHADSDFNACSFNVNGYQLVKFKRTTARKLKSDGVKRFIIEFSVEIGEI